MCKLKMFPILFYNLGEMLTSHRFFEVYSTDIVTQHDAYTSKTKQRQTPPEERTPHPTEEHHTQQEQYIQLRDTSQNWGTSYQTEEHHIQLRNTRHNWGTSHKTEEHHTHLRNTTPPIEARQHCAIQQLIKLYPLWTSLYPPPPLQLCKDVFFLSSYIHTVLFCIILYTVLLLCVCI
jgi:hypothetical protein